MKIRMLGTGYGVCKIKKRFSKDFRRKGGVVIDDCLLIDAPDDIYDAAFDLACPELLQGIKAVLISHSHPGHFSPEVLMRMSERRKISVYASDAVLELLPDSKNIEKHPILPFLPFDALAYKIIPLPANHSTDNPQEDVFNFVITSQKTLFYALDGALINYEAYKILSGIKLDAVIADCALEMANVGAHSMSHGSLRTNALVRDILVGCGIAAPSVRFVLSHIPTDKKREIHVPLCEAAAELGLLVAYDGYFMSI